MLVELEANNTKMHKIIVNEELSAPGYILLLTVCGR